MLFRFTFKGLVELPNEKERWVYIHDTLKKKFGACLLNDEEMQVLSRLTVDFTPALIKNCISTVIQEQQTEDMKKTQFKKRLELKNEIDHVYNVCQKGEHPDVECAFEDLPGGPDSLRGTHPKFEKLQAQFISSIDYIDLLENTKLQRFQVEFGTKYVMQATKDQKPELVDHLSSVVDFWGSIYLRFTNAIESCHDITENCKCKCCCTGHQSLGMEMSNLEPPEPITNQPSSALPRHLLESSALCPLIPPM